MVLVLLQFRAANVSRIPVSKLSFLKKIKIKNELRRLVCLVPADVPCVIFCKLPLVPSFPSSVFTD